MWENIRRASMRQIVKGRKLSSVCCEKEYIPSRYLYLKKFWGICLDMRTVWSCSIIIRKIGNEKMNTIILSEGRHRITDRACRYILTRVKRDKKSLKYGLNWKLHDPAGIEENFDIQLYIIFRKQTSLPHGRTGDRWWNPVI